MARSNYYSYLDTDKAEAYDPRPKKFLYVYRALLGAEYVNENEDIIADVRELGAEVSHADTVLIDDLIEAKQDGIESLHGTDLGECARAEIAAAFNELPAEFSDYDKQGYLADIDMWMNHLRR